MKKLVVLLALAFVMCVPDSSYAEAQKPLLTEQPTREEPEELKLSARLLAFNKELNVLRGDVLAALPGVSRKSDKEVILQVSDSLESAEIICFYLRELQHVILHLNAVAKATYYAFGGIETLELSKKRVQGLLSKITGRYGYLESQAALRLADQAKEKLRSLLPLIDELIVHGKQLSRPFDALIKG